MSPEIEKDQPIKRSNGKYPFADMDIGDSFAVGPHELRTVRTYASVHNSGGKMRFSVRWTGHEYRCWRIN